jgi:hypothetical protein
MDIPLTDCEEGRTWREDDMVEKEDSHVEAA